MNGTYFLHRSPMHPRRAFAEIPKGRVALIGEPAVGESMIIVPEGGGVVHTSPVHTVKRTDSGFLVETANSVYRFTNIRSLTGEAA
ncbi:MAG TPA: hypothetical protein VFG69_04710 [Nannocystaceae bacterium]|nr:hypothetical protein [Nannocystaceae bacterium]